MRVLLLLSLVGLSYAIEGFYFNCTSKQLLPVGFEHEPTQNSGKFVLEVENYTPGQPMFLKLKSMDRNYKIKAFIIQVVTPCTGVCETRSPIGTFTVGGAGAAAGRCLAENDHVIKAGFDLTDKVEYISWMIGHEGPPKIDVIATVVDGENHVHVDIMQSKTSHNPHTQGEDVEVNPNDPHNARSEFEEHESNPDLDIEEDGGINREEVEEEGPFENPNEEEEREEQERQESLARDRQGEFDDDHGFREETELQLKEQEEEAKRIRDEELESEADWVRKQYEQEEEDKNEFDKEMQEYEVQMAEEERKRMEIIAWEIKDKEEHDRLMAEEEKEKESNNTPKDGDKDDEPPKDVEVPKEDIEININEEIFIQDSGCATIVASVTLLMSALFVLFV